MPLSFRSEFNRAELRGTEECGADASARGRSGDLEIFIGTLGEEVGSALRPLLSSMVGHEMQESDIGLLKKD